MHFSTSTVLSTLFLTSSVLGATMGLRVRDQDDDSNPNVNIFPSDDTYNDYAICKGKINKNKFPNLQAPSQDGGCVRYFPGIDITGVVTEGLYPPPSFSQAMLSRDPSVDLFFRDGIHNACDCAARCLEAPTSCTNWVFKHAFKAGDDNKRSCTLYSSPNLPLNVTLQYDLGGSSGEMPIGQGNNPQKGCDAPLTFLDAASTKVDKYGVSGFAVRDIQGRQYC
jgi:hypothetical protein